MKKVLFLIDSLNGGGAEKILLDIILNLPKNKFDIHIMTVWNRGIYVEQVKDRYNYKYIFDVDKKCILNKLKGFFSDKIMKYIYPPILHFLFIKEDYDVEVAFLEGFSTKLISGSKKHIKKYAWVHTDMCNNLWYTQFYSGKKDLIHTYNKFDNIVTVSNSCKTSFMNLTGIYNNVKTLYNPINEVDIINKSKICSYNLKKRDKVKFITVGRLEYEKGYDNLIAVLGKLRKKGYQFELYIIGEGKEKQNLKKMIEDNNLKKDVFLLGYLENPYSIMSQGDVFISSSRTEGFSTVVAEALILGMPVIATNCSGMNELLGKNNEFGIVVENTQQSLFNAIKEVLDNKEILKEYSLKSTMRGKMFKLSNSIKNIEYLLDS